MITQQQAQNCIAYLELSRTAIDNAECLLIGAANGDCPAIKLCIASAEILAAVHNLATAAKAIEIVAKETMQEEGRAAGLVRPTAG